MIDSAAGAAIKVRNSLRIGRRSFVSGDRIATRLALLNPLLGQIELTELAGQLIWNCFASGTESPSAPPSGLPNLKIQLQVDPGLQQNLLTNAFDQTQALIAGGPAMCHQIMRLAGIQ